MEKATDPRPVLVKIFYGGALALLGWFFLSGIAAIGRKSPLPLLTALGFLALLLGAVWMTERLREKITPRVFFLLCLGAAAALGTAQLFAAKQLLVRPGWDFGAVHQSAMEYALHGRIITHEHYFERFSNNTGLLVWEIAAYRLLAMLGLSSDQLFLAAGIAMNLCAIDLAILFTVLFAGRVWGRARGVQALFLCMLFTPYVLYAPIFYTDSMSLPFTALPLYLFARYNDAKSPAARTALCGSIGLLLAFGTKVKGNIAVLLVAFCLYAAFSILAGSASRRSCWRLGFPFSDFRRCSTAR